MSSAETKDVWENLVLHDKVKVHLDKSYIKLFKAKLARYKNRVQEEYADLVPTNARLEYSVTQLPNNVIALTITLAVPASGIIKMEIVK